MMAAYSGTPLAKKLGFQANQAVYLVDAPAEYPQWLEPLPDNIKFITRLPKEPVAFAHIFCREKSLLDQHLTLLRARLKQDGCIWVSWPKKRSKVKTDITENTIRDIALPMDFVDVKVCAVSEVWSGLKLVIRKSARRDTVD